MSKLMIEVNRGVVTNIVATQEISIFLLDHDNLKERGENTCQAREAMQPHFITYEEGQENTPIFDDNLTVALNEYEIVSPNEDPENAPIFDDNLTVALNESEIELSPEDWTEVYYASVDKQARIDNEGDTENIPEDCLDIHEWNDHLGEIIDKIGPDGENMYPAPTI